MVPVQRFYRQIGGTLQMLEYFLLMQGTFPQVMVQLTPEQTKKIGPQVREWIEFCRTVYEMPDLGCKPPDPTPVDPKCPPHRLSDEIRSLLGKNHAFFDFVHAPFTHPIGTQISVTCITTCWNAYDTFIKETVSAIRASHSNTERVHALISAENELKEKEQLGSDRKLHILGVGVTAEDLKQIANEHSREAHFRPEWAETILRAGKEIRRSFTHKYGEPTEQLEEMMSKYSCGELGFRRINGEFEVMLVASRDIQEVILLKAMLVANKSRALYGSAH